jgi:excisionase family DNA binding protein
MTNMTEGTRVQKKRRMDLDMQTNSAGIAEGDDPLLDTSEAAAYLGVSRGWLYSNKRDFSFTMVGDRMRFRTSDLNVYLEKRRHHPVKPCGTIDQVLPSA